MIDIHSHILPDTDDGSRSLEESIEILREAEEIRIFNYYFNFSLL